MLMRKLVLLLIFPLTAIAQIKDRAFEHVLPIPVNPVAENPMPSVFIGKRFETLKIAHSKSPMPFTSQSHGILDKRYSVFVNETFRNEKIEQTIRKFESLLLRNKKSGISTDVSAIYFADKLQLGMSSLDKENRVWTTHLQRTDFEMIAGALSLNDINRFQFRRNRRAGSIIPIKKPSGVLSVLE